MTDNYRSSRQVVGVTNAFASRSMHGRMKQMPIVAMRDEAGLVCVTHHRSAYMYQPLVEQLIAKRGKGTSCVLTQTNEEAVIVMALLQKNGINSKLIQSMDGFRFGNLAEIKYFMKYIDKRAATPLVADELWDEAKRATYAYYERSTAMPYVWQCLELFEQTNKMKYRSDFREFVFESSVEDFCNVTDAEVVVSTIHKAKGCEFDDVYMLVSDTPWKDDALMRRYYVGMTRAKNRLFIHTNGPCFDHLESAQHVNSQDQYPMPKEIVLQLSHRDVFLSYFKERKQDVLALQAGDALYFSNDVLYSCCGNKPVARLSTNMQATLKEWVAKGYQIASSSVRFIVAWKPKDAPKDEKETAVLLADLILSKPQKESDKIEE